LRLDGGSVGQHAMLAAGMLKAGPTNRQQRLVGALNALTG
jgi:hypothetical protein